MQTFLTVIVMLILGYFVKYFLLLLLFLMFILTIKYHAKYFIKKNDCIDLNFIQLVIANLCIISFYGWIGFLTWFILNLDKFF